MTRIDTHVARLQAHGWGWPIPWEAVEALARNEDCRTSAYLCPASVWTIGWGETMGVTADMRWTEDQADARFLQQVTKYTHRVEALLTAPANANQLGALVRLAYNIGLQGLAGSTVLRQHNAGNFDAAARAFGLWNKARVGGVLQVLNGLTLRRAAEAAMYLSPVGDAPAPRMPQAVAPESTLAKSPMARDGVLAAGSGAALAVPTMADHLGQASGLVATVKGIAQQAADFIGVPPLLIVAAVLVYVGFNEVRWRRRQRQEGHA